MYKNIFLCFQGCIKTSINNKNVTYMGFPNGSRPVFDN